MTSRVKVMFRALMGREVTVAVIAVIFNCVRYNTYQQDFPPLADNHAPSQGGSWVATGGYSRDANVRQWALEVAGITVEADVTNEGFRSKTPDDVSSQVSECQQISQSCTAKSSRF